MNSDLVLAGLATVLVGTACLGGLPVLLRECPRSQSKLMAAGQAFASGVFLGAGLVHMLPEAATGFAAQGGSIVAYGLAGFTMILLAGLERFGARAEAAKPTLPVIAALVLGVHSLLAGAALGAAPTGLLALVIFVALVAHKGAASLSLALLLARSGLARASQLTLFIAFVLCLPIGVVAGRLAIALGGAPPLLTPVILAVSAGTFLHLAAERTLPSRETSLTLQLALALAGFALMVAIARFV